MSFLVETHFHTSETSPCGRVPAAEGIRAYQRLGYDAVVVTDHFFTGFFETHARLPWPEQVDRYLEGWRRAKTAGDACGVRVLLGMEYAFPGTYDDMLVYGATPELLYGNPDLFRLGPAGFGRFVQTHGLLVIQAHPYRPYISRVYDELVEGLEVYNGNPRHMSDNARADRLARANGWIGISGSDFHQPGDEGRGGIRLQALPADSADLAAMLRQHRNPVCIRA